MAPIYTFECWVKKHHYEGIRPLSHVGVEGCEECEKDGLFSYAHRVISQAQVHIPQRAIRNKFADDTFKFAESKTKEAESKTRKIQPERMVRH